MNTRLCCMFRCGLISAIFSYFSGLFHWHILLDILHRLYMKVQILGLSGWIMHIHLLTCHALRGVNSQHAKWPFTYQFWLPIYEYLRLNWYGAPAASSMVWMGYHRKVHALALCRCGSNFKSVMLRIVMFGRMSCEIALRWMSQNTFDDKIRVVLCRHMRHQATLNWLRKRRRRKRKMLNKVKYAVSHVRSQSMPDIFVVLYVRSKHDNDITEASGVSNHWQIDFLFNNVSDKQQRNIKGSCNWPFMR